MSFCVTQCQLERDKLHKTFSENVQKEQHNAGLKIIRLEKSLKAVTDSLEKTQAQFSSVLSASNMDQTALCGVTNKVEVLLFTPLLFPPLPATVIDARLFISDVVISIL